MVIKTRTLEIEERVFPAIVFIFSLFSIFFCLYCFSFRFFMYFCKRILKFHYAEGCWSTGKRKKLLLCNIQCSKLGYARNRKQKLKWLPLNQCLDWTSCFLEVSYMMHHFMQVDYQSIIVRTTVQIVVFSIFNFFFSFHLTAGHVGSQFPDLGLNPCPVQWKHSILIMGPPRKSLLFYF